MNYLGGKFKIRKPISAFLESIREGRDYLEPFVGGAWVLQEIKGKRVASDNNSALITMYKALQNGWIPPEEVSEELYQKYRANKDSSDPLTAFIGFACSFSGKWFGGYARSRGRNQAKDGGTSLLRQLPLIEGVSFFVKDYRDWKVEENLIYCDPPYENTTRYRYKFNNVVFWEKMREWSGNNKVVISGYSAPRDFECVLEIPTVNSIRNSENVAVRVKEKLFMFRG